MSDETPPVEWHPREHFAEIAETLNISTEYIFAAYPLTAYSGWAVLFTPGWEEGDQTMHLAVLIHDSDRILRTSGRTHPIPGFSGNLDELLKTAREVDEGRTG